RAQARRGAAPTWYASSSTLLWVDAAEAVIHRSNPAAGTGESMVAPQPVGSVKPRMRGGLVANLQDGIALLDALGSRRWLVYWERAGFHAGEMAVDQLGRLLALSNPAAGSGGWLARVDGTGAAKVLAADWAGCGG